MTEDAISDVIIAFNEGFYLTPTAAAKAYDVAPRTVQRRVQGMGSRSSQTPSNRALNLEQEQAIRNYLKRLDDAGISARSVGTVSPRQSPTRLTSPPAATRSICT